MRSSWLTASRPVRSEATTSMSGSAPIQRDIIPRMTTESSTTITRTLSVRVDVGTAALVDATLMTSPATQHDAQQPLSRGLLPSDQTQT